MGKIAVVHWSGTGNTEAMAGAVADGARNAGAEVSVFTSADFAPAKMDEYDTVAACQSLGAALV